MLPKRVSPDPEGWGPLDVIVFTTCVFFWSVLIWESLGCPALGCR